MSLIHNMRTKQLVNVNGQHYMAGVDQHGYFSIIPVERNPYFDEEPASGPEWLPYEGDKQLNVNLDQHSALEIAEHITEAFA